MIGKLTGTIDFRGDRFVILDVGGVGYKLFLSAETLKAAKNKKGQVSFWTHLAVKDDALDLYGFINQRELHFFELLLSVPGVGPKSALAILSLAPPDTLEKAVRASDSGYLTKVSGIGKKSAERIVLTLQDKLGALPGSEEGVNLAEEAEALDALRTLGYNLPEAREALKKIPEDVTDTAGKIKSALKVLGK